MNAARAWPLALVAVLALTVTANVALWRQANPPGGIGVEPDYYRRAIGWDSTQAERTRSAALGWTVGASFAGEGGLHTMTVELRDAHGRALDGARLEARLDHNLDPGHPQVLPLSAAGGGRYVASVRLTHPGAWDVRVHAARGGDEFVAETRAEAADASHQP